MYTRYGATQEVTSQAGMLSGKRAVKRRGGIMSSEPVKSNGKLNRWPDEAEAPCTQHPISAWYYLPLGHMLSDYKPNLRCGVVPRQVKLFGPDITVITGIKWLRNLPVLVQKLYQTISVRMILYRCWMVEYFPNRDQIENRRRWSRIYYMGQFPSADRHTCPGYSRSTMWPQIYPLKRLLHCECMVVSEFW